MIKKILPRYSWNYPRALVYMLQASEYNIGDFLDWHHQTGNFNYKDVARRKKLVLTPKAVLLLVIAWVILILLYATGLGFSPLIRGSERGSIIITLLIIFSTPFVLPYLLAINTFLINIFFQKPAEYFIVKRARKKLANHKGFKIAIAGSFGKTSMKEILKATLSDGKKVAVPPKNYNTPIGISRFINQLKDNEEILIFEFGEYYPGDIKKLCQLVRPDMGIITGINEAHLKKFKSIDKVIKTIFELGQWLDFRRSLSSNNTLYVNGESELAKEYAPEGCVFYNRQGVDNWQIRNSRTSLEGTAFNMSRLNLDINIKTELIGLHQIGPIVTAVDIALRLGVAPEKIKEGIKTLKPLPHRLNPQVSGGTVIIDDSYNGNPDGVEAAIDFLKRISPLTPPYEGGETKQKRRRIYITPGLVEMGERTEVVHKQIGKWLAEAKIEKVILIKNSVTPFIIKGLKEANYQGEVIWYESGPEAHTAIPFITSKNDVVLIQNDWGDQYS